MWGMTNAHELEERDFEEDAPGYDPEPVTFDDEEPF